MIHRQSTIESNFFVLAIGLQLKNVVRQGDKPVACQPYVDSDTNIERAHALAINTPSRHCVPHPLMPGWSQNTFENEFQTTASRRRYRCIIARRRSHQLRRKQCRMTQREDFPMLEPAAPYPRVAASAAREANRPRSRKQSNVVSSTSIRAGARSTAMQLPSTFSRTKFDCRSSHWRIAGFRSADCSCRRVVVWRAANSRRRIAHASLASQSSSLNLQPGE
jgi:hypothetical protein